MDSELSASFRTIAKGTSLGLIGVFIYTLLTLVTRVILARSISIGDYGVWSLSIAILGICVTFACVGLEEGVTRQISFFRGKKNTKKINNSASGAFLVTLITSIIIAAILWVLAKDFAILFNVPLLSEVLPIFAAVLPFAALIKILIAIMRGFDKVTPKVMFNDFSVGFLQVILFGIIAVLGFSLFSFVIAYFISILTTSLITLFYIFRKRLFSFSISKEITNAILIFSIPLLITSIIWILIEALPTLFLGYYNTIENVGLYNAALPLIKLTPIMMSTVAFVRKRDI